MNTYGTLIALLIFFIFARAQELPQAFEYPEYVEFIHGYLVGVRIQDKDTPELLKCVDDAVYTRTKFIDHLNQLAKTNFDNLPFLADLIANLYGYLTGTVIIIDFCTGVTDYRHVILQKIYHMMYTTIVKRLMLNFISNSQMIMKDINDAVDNYHLGKYKLLGQDLGDIMHLLLTYAIEQPLITLPEYLNIVKGLFLGLSIKDGVDSILKCIDGVPEVINKLMAILYNLGVKEIDMLVQTISELYIEMKEVLDKLVECADSAVDFKRLAKKILNVDLVYFLEVVRKNYALIFINLLDAKNAFLQREFQNLGEAVGKMLYHLLLEAELITIE